LVNKLRDKFYIRGLDGLRFLGSLLILLHHTEKGKVLFGYESHYSFTNGMGHTAMTLFFTLSGFLITYILLKEKKETGTISLINFYKRRISRIWPLYYILIFLSLFFFSQSNLFYMPGTNASVNYFVALPLYFFQLPNLHVFFSGALLVALGHLWTIGVEEQFYAITPLLLKKTKNIAKALVIIILIKFLITIVFSILFNFSLLPAEVLNSLKVTKHFLFNLRFEAFAVGGLGAYFFIEKKESILYYVNQPMIKYFNLGLLILTMGLGNASQLLHLFFAVSFTYIIVSLASKNQPIFFLDNFIITYIGKISYGLYMYQLPVIYIVSNLLRPYYTSSNLLSWNIIYYILCLCISFGISILSYEFVERKIIALARK